MNHVYPERIVVFRIDDGHLPFNVEHEVSQFLSSILESVVLPDDVKYKPMFAMVVVQERSNPQFFRSSVRLISLKFILVLYDIHLTEYFLSYLGIRTD